MLIELKDDSLETIITQNENVFAMFGASWCGACKMSKPKVKRMASENESVTFVYIDAEFSTQSREVAAPIRNLPTFVAFKNGEMIAKEPGTKSIQAVLDSLLG